MPTTAIRDYLLKRGANNNDISYQDGSVYLKGRRFMDATPNEEGRTYADTGALDNAYNNYDTQDKISSLYTRAQAPNAEQTSLQQAIRERLTKPIAQFNYDQNTDPQYQAAVRQAQQNAQTGGNNAIVALGARGIGNSSITSDRVAQIQQKELGNVTANVLPQLISQAYQRYMGQNQLENQQLGNMMNLYQQGQNDQNQQYSQLAQALGLQNNYNQQQFQNQQTLDQAARQNKLDNQSIAQWYTQTYGKPFDPKQDWGLLAQDAQGLTPLAMQQFLQQQKAQDAGFTGMYNDQPTIQKLAQDATYSGMYNGALTPQAKQINASIANIGADNARAGEAATQTKKNQEQQRLIEIWKTQGTAPAGIDGVAEGTPYAGMAKSNKAGTYKTNPEYAKEIQYINANPTTATDEILNNAPSIIEAYGTDGYNALLAEARRLQKSK